ncbi:microtubule associated protein SPM1 [Besnoitia besnoiti]|uniref:Microtubule associated protein SPM1 n=1 Tax=Besnoitia besnoiti TaxID=94643 RepID=A0A2A9MII8_BESBE|nr:microtubule associated protein SPM1 [Besnoitia besnoiti]PFH37719.1 microtubule associated protein SPM1 [Besnoitia besnoiti]
MTGKDWKQQKLPGDNESDSGYPQKPQKYEQAKYEAAKYEATKYEPSKYEAAKYEATKYEPSKYEAAKYEATKCEPMEPSYAQGNGKSAAAYEYAQPADYQMPAPQEPEVRHDAQGPSRGSQMAMQRARERFTSSHMPAMHAPGEMPVRRLQLSEVDEHRRSQSPSKKAGYCVDELCSCGMHKCTPSRTPLPFEGNTHYREEFVAKPLPPQMRPGEVHVPPSLPFEAESSYRTEYGPKPLPTPLQPAEVKLPPSLPFEGQSAYRADYGPKPLPPQMRPGEVKLPPTLPFEAESSYRTEYGPKPLPAPIRPAEVKMPPTLPFEGNTQYREEFVPKPLPPTMKPAEVKLPPSLPFDANSMYRSQYVPKENPVCQLTRLPQYPQASYPSNHVFWDSVTKQWY